MNRTRMHARSLRSHRGFTLIEMLVVTVLIGIVTMLAAPSFNSAILGSKLTSYANSFMASAQLARSEAIKRNANGQSPTGVVRLCRSANGTSCVSTGTFQQGWLVFHDKNNDGDVSTGETVIQVQQALSSDYHFNSDAYSIVFTGSGVGTTAASLVLCRATPSPGEQERAIRVEGIGRASVSTTKTGTCA